MFGTRIFSRIASDGCRAAPPPHTVLGPYRASPNYGERGNIEVVRTQRFSRIASERLISGSASARRPCFQ